MRRYFPIIAACAALLCLPAPAAAQKAARAHGDRPAAVEVPNTIRWLPGKRLFMDRRGRFIVAALRRPDAERVLTHAIRWDERIYWFFRLRKTAKQPVLIAVMENEREMKLISKQKRFQGMSISIPTATEDARIILLTNNKEGLRNILPHELAHLCVIDLARSPVRMKDRTHPAPLCINEGIAEQFASETEKRNIRTYLYGAVVRNKFLYLDTILYTSRYPGNMRDLALFYCQSYSLIDYVLRSPDGKKRLMRYLQRFDHRTENPYELFKEIFCDRVSSDAFKKGWKRYIYDEYRPAPKRSAGRTAKGSNRARPARRFTDVRQKNARSGPGIPAGQGSRRDQHPG